MSSKGRNLGFLYAFIATALWGGAFVVARAAVGEISPMTFGATRWLITLLVLCAFSLPKLKNEWPIAKSFMPQILIAALTGVTLYAPLSYFAAATTSAVNLGLIAICTPIFVIILLALIGEKQEMNKWIGCLFGLFGSVYLITNGKFSSLINLEFSQGDLIMLIDAIGFAIYGIVLRKIPEGLSQSTILTLMSFFGLIMMLPVLIWEWNQPDMVFNLNTIVLFSVIFASLGCSLAAWWTWNLGLEYAGPVLANIIYYTLPLFSGVFGYIFLKEKMSSVHLVSGAFIIGGIYWASRTRKTSNETSS